jgi:hypothetical protein
MLHCRIGLPLTASGSRSAGREPQEIQRRELLSRSLRTWPIGSPWSGAFRRHLQPAEANNSIPTHQPIRNSYSQTPSGGMSCRLERVARRSRRMFPPERSGSKRSKASFRCLSERKSKSRVRSSQSRPHLHPMQRLQDHRHCKSSSSRRSLRRASSGLIRRITTRSRSTS